MLITAEFHDNDMARFGQEHMAVVSKSSSDKKILAEIIQI